MRGERGADLLERVALDLAGHLVHLLRFDPGVDDQTPALLQRRDRCLAEELEERIAGLRHRAPPDPDTATGRAWYRCRCARAGRGAGLPRRCDPCGSPGSGPRAELSTACGQ